MEHRDIVTASMRLPRTVSIASYNVHRGVGVDWRYRPDRVAAVVEEMNADILALQEIDWRNQHGLAETQFEYFQRKAGFTVVPGANILNHRGHFGNVLLSRFPVKAVRHVDLRVGNFEPRGVIDVDLQIGPLTLRVMATHLGLRLRERHKQVRRLYENLTMPPLQPTLLIGDFNDWMPGGPSIRSLTNLCQQPSAPRSYPAGRPIFPLDRILLCYGQGLGKVTSHISTLSRVASDHLPVVASLDCHALWQHIQTEQDIVNYKELASPVEI